MADDNNSTSPPPARTRRSSFAGETFANLFGTGARGGASRTSAESTNNQQPAPQQYPGPITTAAAQAQRRRLSLTTLGLSGSPNQSSPFGSYPGRRDSYVSGTSDSIDESAIEEDSAASGPTPQTPFARRVSFGAKALRDVRAGGGNASPGQNGSSEGFNWSENFRTRAERASSLAGSNGVPNVNCGSSPRSVHSRSASVAVMEPPAREMPKPREQGRPDHFQERILKGDFYMD